MRGVVRAHLAVIGVVATAVVACLAVVGWQWRHPHAFDVAGGWGMSSPVKIGDPFYVGMSYDAKGEHATAILHHLSANVVQNTSHARIRFYVCQVDEGEHIGAIGSAGRNIRKYCHALIPIDETRLRLGRTPMDQILVGVFPTRPGRVKIQSIDVNYTRGWQTGTQTIGGEVVVRTKS